ncbi:MAG: cupredoxin family copper-binding protein [Patescibacteria group bacterium]|nr:cupredoxin family copper-binding protein [Patescibacteria group bacterium]
MKKFLSLSLLLGAVILMANSCATSPAANKNIPPAANTGGFTVAPGAPATTPTPTPAPVSNTPNASVSSSSTPAPTPPPAPITPPAVTQGQVNIQNFSFNPAEVTVAVGDTVVWTNNDSVRHQIASDSFNSVPLPQGGSFSHTFTAAGTFDYHCAIHPSMTGKIIVK